MPFDAWMDESAAIHDGSLRTKSFKAPALCTLIDGDLEVDGVVDLETDGSERGLFVVTGNVTCQYFISEYGACTFIDGNLNARDAIINAFQDSSLVVIGSLATRLFIGADIWAEVGGDASMDYGSGYCLPLGRNTDANAADIIRPRHNEAATADVVVPPANSSGYAFREDHFAERIRAGLPIFR